MNPLHAVARVGRLLLLALVAVPATAQDRDADTEPDSGLQDGFGLAVNHGDRVLGAIDHDGDEDAFDLQVLEGSTVSVSIRAKRSSALLPVIRLFRPDGTPADLGGTRIKRPGTQRPALRPFLAEQGTTGRWTLVLSGQPGQTGAYTAKFKIKHPRRLVDENVPYVRDAEVFTRPIRIALNRFPVLPGTRVDVRAFIGTEPKEGTDTRIGLVRIPDDGGTPISISTEATERKGRRLFVRKWEADRPGVMGCRISDRTVYEPGAEQIEAVDFVTKLKHPRVRGRRIKLPPEGRLLSVTPATLRQEDLARTLVLHGQGLPAELDMEITGEGLDLVEITSRTTERIEALVTVSHDAPLIVRDVVLRPIDVPGEALVLRDAVEILPPDPALDDKAPIIAAVVINDIPSDMDGSGTYLEAEQEQEFDLLLPRTGFELRLDWSDRGGSGLSPTGLEATCTVAVGTIPAGENLAGLFTADQQAAMLFVPETHPVEAARDVTFTFRVRDGNGNLSNTATITVDVEDKDYQITGADADLERFDEREIWVFRTDLDHYTHRCDGCFEPSTSFPSFIPYATVVGSNDISDFDEALRANSMNSNRMTAAAAQVRDGDDLGTNAIVRRRFLERFRELLRERFGNPPDGSHDADSVDIEFRFDDELAAIPGSEPLATSSSSDTGRRYSEMGLSGSAGPFPSSDPDDTAIGRAAYDFGNTRREANLDTGSTAAANALGVHLTRLARRAPFLHTVAGEHPLDPIVLAPSFDRATETDFDRRVRYDEIHDAIEALALYASAVAAHEIGHSVGLVPNGAPGAGLFGGSDTDNSFIAGPESWNTSHHAAFTGSTRNIMNAIIDYEATQASGAGFVRFHPLILAYLRERVLYGSSR